MSNPVFWVCLYIVESHARNGGADSHKCTSCCRFADGKSSIKTAGVEMEGGEGGGGMAIEAGGVRHCHTVRAADLQSWGCHSPPSNTRTPNVSISFSSQAPERSAESHRGGSSHILTPHRSPSHRLHSFKKKTSCHITLIYSSLCYSQVAGLPTQPSKCLLVLPPLVQW